MWPGFRPGCRSRSRPTTATARRRSASTSCGRRIGHTLDAIRAAEADIPRLSREYPFIDFAVSYTQKDLIERSVDNMLGALRDAIIITVIVIFLFLGNFRTMFLCAISIPFTYLITFAFMWLFGFEFHMVTLTGVILAVGMLLDDAIVVIENIERHYHESK